MSSDKTAGLVFLLALIATFCASIVARKHVVTHGDDVLAGRNLNRWLLGLSAGTTANSGFIVTAAVGLGYTGGVQWLMLPLSWLLGDLAFWYLFPSRINAYGHVTGASTVSEVLTAGLEGPLASSVALIACVLILVCLAGYTSAQWLAGEKFLKGAFGFHPDVAFALFAILIIAYSSIGEFRGAVYTDVLQAAIRIVGTGVALGAVSIAALSDPLAFETNLRLAGESFLNPFPGGTIVTVVGFIVGYAAAAIGFGLGQPQIMTRYLAGASPAETRSARAIYIGFVQVTWILMTLFGVVLRGVMPGIDDPEMGLSVFFQSHMNAILTGLISADIFATISSTSNGLLIAMAQTLKLDLITRLLGKRGARVPLSLVTLAVGATTMLVSSVIHGSVVSLAVTSVSLLGAGLSGAVMAKVLNWRHTGRSLSLSIAAGICAAIGWKYLGWDSALNEAAVGISVGVGVNWVGARWSRGDVSRAEVATLRGWRSRLARERTRRQEE
jgi:Na+/proline symporter